MEAGKFIARFLEINVLALITFCLNTVEYGTCTITYSVHFISCIQYVSF